MSCVNTYVIALQNCIAQQLTVYIWWRLSAIKPEYYIEFCLNPAQSTL